MKSNRLFFVFFLLFALGISARAGINKVHYHTNGQLQAAFQRLHNRFPQLVHVKVLARTRSGLPILVVRLGKGSVKKLDTRPGILVVGSVEGNHLVGSEVALGVVSRLAEAYGHVDSVTVLLNTRTVYVIPRLNPEGAAYFFRRVKWEHPWNNTPTDDDHDGLTDEDGPEDLNGDGFITQMRIKAPDGDYVADAQNPELLRKADPSKGEVGVYKVYMEGKDTDGDGKYNEDGTGGVNIDWNFPQEYPAFRVGAGQYMESEPESRAISKFLFDHRTIALALTYCLHDNVIHPPKPNRQSGAGASFKTKSRWSHFSGPVKSVNRDDLPFFQEISTLYRKTMAIPANAEPVVADDSGKGSLYKWIYFQAGIPSVATSLMLVPEATPQKSTNDSTWTHHSKMRSGKRKMPPARQKQDKLATNRKWLAYFKSRGENGFVPWKPFRHPQLGSVEIGGFVPFARTTAPETAIPDLIQKQVSFWTALLSRLPRVAMQNLRVQKKGDRVYAISLIVRNQGDFPTATAHGAKTRLVRPILIKIFPEKGTLLEGNKIVFIPRLLGKGGAQKVEWLLTAPKGSSVIIQVLTQNAGTVEQKIVLK